MSTTVTVDGTNYEVPANGERGWGLETSNLLIALANNSLLIKGGSIPLTSEADFGGLFGIKTLYYKSQTANPAAAGVHRLANTDTINWRNGANSADLSLSIASDNLQFEGSDLITATSTTTLTNKTIDAALNTLSNIDTTMLAAGVLITSTTLTGAADTNFPSTLAVKTYIDNEVAGKDDATEITYTPTTAGDWPDPDPTNVQTGLDQVASERALKTITVTGINSLNGGGDLSTNRTIDVADGGIDTTELADNAVTTVKITNSNVTSAKLEDDIVFPGSGAVTVPTGNTAARPGAPAEGMIRRNSQLPRWEGYNGTSWEEIGGGSGGTADSLETNDDSTEAGTISVAAGKRRWESDFTISTGDTWTISSGARLIVECALAIDGTLTVNGTSRIF